MEAKIVINNRTISFGLIKELVSDIKKKRELRDVPSEFVKEEIIKYLKHNRKVLNVLTTHRKVKQSSEYKKIIKHARAVLRRVCGVFQAESAGERSACLKELERHKHIKNKSLSIHNKILETHASTKERLQSYPAVYKKIFAITGKPKRIIDLGCGLNPVSYPYMRLKGVHYFAADLNAGGVRFAGKYFKIMGINGEARVMDIAKAEPLKSIPPADICFIFKTLEAIELTKSHRISEEVIKAVPAKWVAASFSTRTITGRRMNHQRRGWLEMMLKRLGYSFTKIVEENEVFYVFEKER